MNKTNLIRTLAVLAAAMLLLAACGPGLQAPQAGPQTWIDAPLQGSTIPLAPYQIVTHAAFPGGISEFELSITGDSPLTLQVPPDQSAESLVYVQHEWIPPAPGTYLIHARAASKDGTYGQIFEAQVHVGDPNLATLPIPPPPATPTATYQAPCIWTADLNVFVRKGPGSSNYDDVDDMAAGDSAPVMGESEDGQFWAVQSSSDVIGYVSKLPRFGHTDGNCAKPKFTPPPTRVPSKTPNLTPQCSDGIDNDGDGRIDFAGGGGDLQCRNANDNDESTP